MDPKFTAHILDGLYRQREGFRTARYQAEIIRIEETADFNRIRAIGYLDAIKLMSANECKTKT